MTAKLSRVCAVALLLGCSAARPDAVGTVSNDAGSKDVELTVEAGGCAYPNAIDDDGDGFTEAEGDCNDCDPRINPGAHDFPGNGIDEDCSGRPDDEVLGCDDSLALDDGDPHRAARALGLCKTATRDGRAWGVVSAKWVKPDGTPLDEPLSYGLLPRFGVNLPVEGQTMLGISSGTARDPSMPGYRDVAGFRKGYTSGTPAGFPKETPACPGVTTGAAHDGAALELEIRVPTNATGFEVSENFFTVEFPGYVCSKFNDWFILEISPRPEGAPDGNVAFDAVGNPISVNTGLLQVCKPQTANGRDYACALGPDTLKDTGFDTGDDPFSPAPHAATGWLTTKARVTPGALVRLRFAVWDSADGNLDSTVLLDDFRWSVSTDVGTTPRPR